MYRPVFSCWVTVDCSDFQIEEPAPFNHKWFSHKFRGPGLRYELAVSLRGGDIVWAHDPFPCGSWPDLSIFRKTLKNLLLSNECVIADRVHGDEKCKLRCDYEGADIAKLARARHETANRCLKQFRVLVSWYRHSLRKHSMCFHAVANLTQLAIERGETLFEI